LLTKSRAKEPTLPFSNLPPFLTSAFAEMAKWLHNCSAARLPALLTGILFARGRLTVTAWFRAAAITDDFRNAYTTVCATGREADAVSVSVLQIVRPLLGPRRLRLAIDDTPTPRYGPKVEGAGSHHNPTPGPAGQRHLYGHVWVTLAALATHEHFGCIPCPCRPNSTSARSIWRNCRPSARARSAPSWRWPHNSCAGRCRGAVVWLALYGAGFLMSLLPAQYPSPDRALHRLPEILRGQYDLRTAYELIIGSAIISVVVALVGMILFSRRDV